MNLDPDRFLAVYLEAVAALLRPNGSDDGESFETRYRVNFLISICRSARGRKSRPRITD
jgi:hypothetical protein